MHRFAFIIAEFDETALILRISFGKSGDRFLPFGVSVREADGAGDIVKTSANIMPDAAPGGEIVARIETELQLLVEKQDFGRFDEFEHKLASEAKKQPAFIQSRIAGKNADSVARDNATFKELSFVSKPKHIRTQAITNQTFVSLFMFESTLAPGVFIVTYNIRDGCPLITSVAFSAGDDAAPFFADMREASSLATAAKPTK